MIVVPEGFQVNPDPNSPFQDLVNPGFELNEMVALPDEKVLIKEISFIQSSSSRDITSIINSNLITSQDNSRFLSSVCSEKKIIQEDLKVSLYRDDINGESNYFRSRYVYSYEEIKKIMLQKWVTEHKFFADNKHEQKNFVQKAKTVLQTFIPNEKFDTFNKILQTAQEEYLNNYEVVNKELEQSYDEVMTPVFEIFITSIKEKYLCQTFIQMDEEAQRQTETDDPQSQTFCDMTKQFFANDNKKQTLEKLKCDNKCNTFYSFYSIQNSQQYILKSNDWFKLEKVYNNLYGSQITLKIHRTELTKFNNLFKTLNQKCSENEKQFKEDREVRLVSLRIHLLKQFFDECDKICKTQKDFFQYPIQIEFNTIKMIRNSDNNQIINWAISKLPASLDHTFICKEVFRQLNVSVKDIFFVSDIAGLVLIQNYPEGKNSIYLFNIGLINQVTFQNITALSSNMAQLFVEPVNRQWCSYDNKEKRVNIGKLSKDGKIEDGAPVDIYHQKSEGHIIETIMSACFMPNGERLMIINQSNEIFEYRWQSRQLNLLLKKENKGGVGILKSPIRPLNPYDKYVSVQATSDGKNFILKSTEQIDIFDLNLDRIHSFHIEQDQFLFFKVFSDKQLNFLVIFNKKENPQCFQLVGLTATKSIKTEISGLQLNKSSGNPIIDHFYHCFQKFGPHSSFIGCPSVTQLTIIVSDHIENKELRQISTIKQYFLNMSIRNVTIKVSKKQNIEEDQSMMPVKRLGMIIMGRIAIHIATIENSGLMPLKNGQNISDQIADNLIFNRNKGVDLIERIIEMIQFGIYDKLLQNSLNKQIHVISVVGRQSSGKSYVMNRFFGTRFNVAATRCTDGIWMSVVEVQDAINSDITKMFVVLDCEGLFSARRNEQEEMKLCLALSAISDIMILNQDLSFNRYLNSLFNNFTKCVGRIKGKCLFKGCLMMLVRDVRSEDAESAYRELHTNFLQLQANRQDGFLSAVFQGNLKSQCLNYFQQPIFNKEIDHVRQKYFMAMNQERWSSGRDLLESIKITLAQVYSDDDTDLDIHKLKISCEHLFNLALEKFYDGGVERFKEDYIINQTYIIDEIEFQVNINQSEITLSRQQQDNDDENSLRADIIVGLFERQTIQYAQNRHNQWVASYNHLLNNTLEARKQLVINQFEQALPQDSEYGEIIKSYIFKLRTEFDTLIQAISYCSKKCRNCERLCTLKLSHKNDCNCETSHTCQVKCEKTQQCIDQNYLCVEIFGHMNDHRCGEGNHRCPVNCQVQSCHYLCKLESSHSLLDGHICGNQHPCAIKCMDSFCTRTCNLDSMVKHEEHLCGEIRCINRCELCDRQCIFPSHMHQSLIESGNEQTLQYNHEGKDILMNYHICENDHLCKDICEEKGVCQIDYKIEERIWKNDFGEFPYPYFLPLNQRNECKLVIDKLKISHGNSHNCKIGSHRCTNQCIECKSFCNRDIDHEGFHKTQTHRNKENNIFVSSSEIEKISIVAEGKKREYKVGESCQPENCTISCGRKGRAHYHLKQCLEEEKCQAKINTSVKHATEKFMPFLDRVYDKWLCQNYWNSFNWEAPIEGGQLEEIQQCNYICGHHSHGEDVRVFCTKSAWHNDVHSFDCEHIGGSSSNIIDIVFCCDTTGSMSSYISKSIETVHNIIKKMAELSVGSTDRSVKFAFVAYKDHCDPKVTLTQPLTDEATVKSFIATLKADGGGDGPEAVFDGMNDAVYKANWREHSMRFMFHIADAPPHGKEFTGGMADNHPGGCPCGLKIEKIASQMKELNIRYKLLKIGSYVNTMASVFKGIIEDFEESELDSATQLDLKVTEILVRDIKTEEQDILLD